ncbi:MAG: hypothetical protein QXK06_04830 [Candidatus Diapherotrites archaeon]
MEKIAFDFKRFAILVLTSIVFFLAGFFLGLQAKPDCNTNTYCPQLESSFDLSKCSGLASGKSDWCVFQEAYEARNNNYCNYIYNANIKNYCFGVLNNDKALCNKVTEEGIRNQCLEIVARQLGE